MSKLFTDEDGNKFELVGEYANPGVVIRPVTEPKAKFWSIWFQENGLDRNSLFTEKLTDKQAEAVDSALTAFVRYLKSPDDKRGGSPPTGFVNDEMRAARHLLAPRPTLPTAETETR